MQLLKAAVCVDVVRFIEIPLHVMLVITGCVVDCVEEYAMTIIFLLDPVAPIEVLLKVAEVPSVCVETVVT